MHVYGIHVFDVAGLFSGLVVRWWSAVEKQRHLDFTFNVYSNTTTPGIIQFEKHVAGLLP
jgi:hypothetical protein